MRFLQLISQLLLSAQLIGGYAPVVYIAAPGILDSKINTPVSLVRTAPAYETGMRYLRATYPRFNWTQEFLSSEDIADCGTLQYNVQRILSRWYYKSRQETDLAVIVAPGCSDAAYMNALAREWDTLLVTGADYKAAMEDRRQHPTFLTTSETTPPSGVLYCALFVKMHWSKLYMLHDRNSSTYYEHQYVPIVNTLKLNCRTELTRNEFTTSDDDSVVAARLLEFHARSRILVYFGGAPGLRKLMIVASSLNMTDGEHVYLAVRPYDSDADFGPYATWLPGASDDQALKQAYQSLLLMTIVDKSRFEDPRVQDLVKSWKSFERAESEILRRAPNELNLPILIGMETALEVVGWAVNRSYTDEMWKHGILPSGIRMAEQLLNKTFSLRVGNVHMLSSAQLAHRHVIYSFDLRSLSFLPSLHSSSDNLAEKYTWIATGDGLWFGQNVFPPNEPHCGFDGMAEACQTFTIRQKLYASFGTIFGVLFLIFSVAAGTIRCIRKEMSWFLIDHRHLLPRLYVRASLR